MSHPAVRIQEISKRYWLGRSGGGDSLRETLTNAASRSFSALVRRGRDRAALTPFWALRDISFNVEQGEILGIIGRNGAGKSTLLKILSRITTPTAGRVEVYGRLVSLLEVGTGFHPDLTGRENVYLNGSILGMRKGEVDRKFDEIVAFSGVEAFLDTPVKRYSSGMYVRLAFSVAAHLEPEILVVDEVLAVGDNEFQKRCLEKMEGAARGGRTVLLVSHNLGTVQAFCTRAVLLQKGEVAAMGTPEETVGFYLRGLESASVEDLRTRTERGGTGEVRVTRFEASMDGAPDGIIATGQPARFVVDLDRARRGATCLFTIYDQVGRPVTYFDSGESREEDVTVSSDPPRFCCEVDELLLVPGRYRVDVTIFADSDIHDHIEGAGFFDVEDGLLRGRRVAPRTPHGNALMPHRWTSPA